MDILAKTIFSYWWPWSCEVIILVIRCDFPIYFNTNPQNTKVAIILIWLMQMTSNLHHNIISRCGTLPESFVKIRHRDVILRHVTSFPYIFLYNDVIGKKCWHQQNMYSQMIFFISSGRVKVEDKSSQALLQTDEEDRN